MSIHTFIVGIGIVPFEVTIPSSSSFPCIDEGSSRHTSNIFSTKYMRVSSHFRGRTSRGLDPFRREEEEVLELEIGIRKDIGPPFSISCTKQQDKTRQ